MGELYFQKPTKYFLLLSNKSLNMTNFLLSFLLCFASFFNHAQTFRYRAYFEEVEINGKKVQSESNKLIIVNRDENYVKIFGFETERFDIYETFEINDSTLMFPSLDKNENNFAIELLFTKKYTYLTIQTPTENEVGEFDHRQFVCKKIED